MAVPPDLSQPPATNPTFLCLVFLNLGLGCLLFTSWLHGIYVSASVSTSEQASVRPLASGSSNTNQKVTQGHTQLGVRIEVHKPRQDLQDLQDFDLQPGSQTPSQPFWDWHVVSELPQPVLQTVGVPGVWVPVAALTVL